MPEIETQIQPPKRNQHRANLQKLLASPEISVDDITHASRQVFHSLVVDHASISTHMVDQSGNETLQKGYAFSAINGAHFLSALQYRINESDRYRSSDYQSDNILRLRRKIKETLQDVPQSEVQDLLLREVDARLDAKDIQKNPPGRDKPSQSLKADAHADAAHTDMGRLQNFIDGYENAHGVVAKSGGHVSLPGKPPEKDLSPKPR